MSALILPKWCSIFSFVFGLISCSSQSVRHNVRYIYQTLCRRYAKKAASRAEDKRYIYLLSSFLKLYN
jgi:hypothetical protein